VDPKHSGSNFYIYALNNPLFFVDRNGKEPTPNPYLYPKPDIFIEEFQTQQNQAKAQQMQATLARAAALKANMNDPNTRNTVIKMLEQRFGTLDTNADPGSGFVNNGPSFSTNWDLGYSFTNFDFLTAKGVTQTKYEAGLDKNWLGRFMFFSNSNVFFNENTTPDTLGANALLDPIQNLPSNANIENILGLQTGTMYNQSVTSYGNFNKTSSSNFNIGFTTPGKTTLAEGWDTIFNNIVFPIAGGLVKGIPAAGAAASVFVNTATKSGMDYWSVMAPIPNPTFEPVGGDMTIPTTPQYLNMNQLMYYYPDFSVDLALGLTVGKEMNK
jgi:hypothetical protein